MAPLISLLFIFANAWASPTLIGGNIDYVDNLNGVIDLEIVSENGSFSCTATKISDKHIITAAHCVHGEKIKRFGLSHKTLNPDSIYQAIDYKEIFVHPSYAKHTVEEAESYENTLTTPDISVIEIIPNEAFKEIKVVTVNFDTIGDDQKIEIWGYGCQESVNTSGAFSVRKRGLTSTVRSWTFMSEDHGRTMNEIYRTYILEIYDTFLITSGKSRVENASSLCPGDSGGPALYMGQLVGINTYYTFDANGSTKGISYLNLHTRVSKVADWLKRILNLE
jgi:secreted trypsin-like serine protease